jgi:hypothetical protein
VSSARCAVFGSMPEAVTGLYHSAPERRSAIFAFVALIVIIT